MKKGTANCVDILIAIILPPLGVFLKFGCKVNLFSPNPAFHQRLQAAPAISLLIFWPPGRVLALPLAHPPRLSSGDHLRDLRHHQGLARMETGESLSTSCPILPSLQPSIGRLNKWSNQELTGTGCILISCSAVNLWTQEPPRRPGCGKILPGVF